MNVRVAVLTVSDEEIEPPSPIVTTTGDGKQSVRNTFITGIAKVDERLIILLDLAKVLSTKEQADLQAMQQDQGDVLPDRP